MKILHSIKVYLSDNGNTCTIMPSTVKQKLTKYDKWFYRVRQLMLRYLKPYRYHSKSKAGNLLDQQILVTQYKISQVT